MKKNEQHNVHWTREHEMCILCVPFDAIFVVVAVAVVVNCVIIAI